MADEKKAAFGVFPQMKPRRSKQDREAAKNVPVDLARGVISGALGIPGDIESLARLPYELITGQESPTILPTSEDIEKRLPFKSDTPVGGVATGLGQIAGGFATPAPAIRAAKKLRQTIGNLPPADPRMSQMGVIKAPGGNWLGGERGSVEGQLGKLKMADLTPEKELAEMQSSIDTAKRIMGNDETVQRTVAQMENELATAKRNNAINKWVDSNLRNYVKKEMGTEGDPVRKLAERGVLHMKPYGTREAGSLVMRKRAGLGYPAQGLGKSEEAQFWERLSDQAIDAYPAGSYKHGALDESLIEANPWLQNVPDEIMIHSGKGLTRELGFDHIIDVLRQDLREGRIRPEQLSKVSMEQAVRRTYEYDQEMAKKMREAQIKATEGMPVYKEYPEGYKWVELKAQEPESLPEGVKRVQQSVTQGGLDVPGVGFVPAKWNPEKGLDWEQAELDARKALSYEPTEKALKYEGETMGHCVGGYCPDVMEGRSRIFSLRDAKGEPHVTVEVQPNIYTPRWDDVKPYLEGAKEQVIKDRIANNLPEASADEMERLTQAYAVDMAKKNSPPNIIQIKGKQNRAPKEEYLPFVQDFVKSGQWSKVGDLGNTGLQKVEEGSIPGFQEWMRLKALGNEPKIPAGYYKPEELLQFGSESGLKEAHPSVYKKWRENLGLPPEEGMKKGGKVRFTDNPDAMRLELQMAAGGIAKGLKAAAKAAKAGSDAPKPIVEAPSIIIPSKIQNVREAVRKREGNYGAKRVERAADEIRNLERMYTEKALIDAFVGDNAKAVVTMSPADFERYAEQLKGRTSTDIGPKMAELARQGEIDKYTVPTEEYIQHLMRVQGGFDQVPYLNLYKDEVGLPIKPEVRGHEGRHRSRALTEAGEPSALVEIKPRGDLREGLPRRSQEEFIEALREELRLSDRLVLPQTDGTSRRPAIILPEPYAEGGKVRMAAGGLAKAAKALKAAKEPPIKASEALGRVEGRPLVITQADRTKVGGGYLGGPGFSGLQLTEPEYRAAEAAWGVKTPGVAKMILGGGKAAGKDPVYAAMLGTPTQHQSNQMVFDKLYGDFKKSAKKGNLDTELRDLINTRLASAVDKKGNPVFPPDVDILGKNFKDLANTFDRRAVTANLIGGVTVGGKKGQIIDYDKIIRETTDPLLIEAPTGAVGNRLFTLSGGIIDRPDLHPAFPTILQGEDLGVSFNPVTRDLIMKDFIQQTMREKGRAPGYMDYTRGYPPSQLITEDLLTELQKLGLKEGGKVTSPAAQIDGNDFLLAARRHGLSEDIETLNKMVRLVNQGATVDEAARIVSGNAVSKAAGGEISADDLIIEERPL